MPYCSADDVLTACGGSDRYVELTDWDADGDADAAVVTDHIAEADATIDSYVNRRYLVPLDPVPDSVRRRSAQLAKVYLRRDRGQLTEDDSKNEESITKWLVGVGSGEILLGLEPLNTKSSIIRDENLAVDTMGTPREKLRGFW